MRFTKIGKISAGQDGAVWGKFLFRFEGNSVCHVYSLDTLEKVSEFSLDQTQDWLPHSNAVTFGCEYCEEGDEFPLLYSNVYNNYAKEADRRVGVCCVYRLTREGHTFHTRLVQTVTVGFTEDESLWCSEGKADIRPYGNFTIDRDREIYYGFTMRDTSASTPYFAFRLPKLADGKAVTLTPEDILSRFDCPYHRFLQGACCHKGLIYSLEGFTSDGGNPPAMRIISAEEGRQLQYILLSDYGLEFEPEFIDFCGDRCYYSDCKGNLYNIEF